MHSLPRLRVNAGHQRSYQRLTVESKRRKVPRSRPYSPTGTPIEGDGALVTGGNRGFGRAVVDDPARWVKSQLSQDITALYSQLVPA